MEGTPTETERPPLTSEQKVDLIQRELVACGTDPVNIALATNALLNAAANADEPARLDTDPVRVS